MANPLIGALLGGIEGGAKANYQDVMAEAEQERKLSYQKLVQQYAKDNIVLADELASKRQTMQWDREDVRTADNREYEQKEKQIAELNATAKENTASADAWDRLKYQGDRADKTADRADARADARLDAENKKPGEMGRLFKDLSGIYGEDKAREMLQRTVDSKQKGQLTPAEMADIRAKAVKLVSDQYQDQLAMAKSPDERAALTNRMSMEADNLAKRLVGQTPEDDGMRDVIAKLASKDGQKKDAPKPESSLISSKIKSEHATEVAQAEQRIAQAEAIGETPDPEDVAIVEGESLIANVKRKSAEYNKSLNNPGKSKPVN
jgi:hypothetical protein